MDHEGVVLHVSDISDVSAGQHTKALGAEIVKADGSITVKQRSDNDEALDFGSTLVLVLAAPAVVKLASAIYAYMKRAGVRVEIVEDGRRIQLHGLDSEDIAKAIEAARGAPKTKWR